MLIDEIDLHLHPRWQRMIMKQFSDHFTNVQFVATTHSPLDDHLHERCQRSRAQTN